MKINPLNSPAMIGKYKDVVRKTNDTKVNQVTSDKFEISESGKAFASALEASRNVPEVRADYVAKIKEMVDNGTYKVDSRAIADKMIKGVTLK